jgi:PAS domain S-box-containing protein
VAGCCKITVVTDFVGWPAPAPEALPTVLLRAVAVAGQGITITDATAPDNPLVYANDAFLSLAGTSSAQVLGRNCRFMQGPGTDPAALVVLKDAVLAGQEASVVLLNYRQDGTAFWNEVSVSPVHDPTGRVTHFIGCQVDVTERVVLDEVLLEHARRDPNADFDAGELLAQRLGRLVPAPTGSRQGDGPPSRRHRSGADQPSVDQSGGTAPDPPTSSPELTGLAMREAEIIAEAQGVVAAAAERLDRHGRARLLRELVRGLRDHVEQHDTDGGGPSGPDRHERRGATRPAAATTHHVTDPAAPAGPDRLAPSTSSSASDGPSPGPIGTP